MNALHRRVGFQCLSELRLDQLIAGELGAAAAEESERHLARCETCERRRKERLAEQTLFQELAPPFLASPAPLAARSPAPTASRRRVRTVAMLGALAAAVALFPLARRLTEAPETTTAKGEQALRFFVRHRGQVREGRPGERLEPNDQLRFALTPRSVDGRYAAVFSRDSAGKATVYFPERPTASSKFARVPETEDGLLPYSIRLDDVLGAETLYLLLCRDPLALEPIRLKIEKGNTSQPNWVRLLPSSCTVEIHSIEKVRGV